MESPKRLHIGFNIKTIRKARNLSQADLALLLAVCRVTVARWESEARMPSLRMIERIASALECTSEELIYGS